MEFPADELEGLADGDGVGDTGKGEHQVTKLDRIAAQDADGRPLLAGKLERTKAVLPHFLHDGIDLVGWRVRLHEDQHGGLQATGTT